MSDAKPVVIAVILPSKPGEVRLEIGCSSGQAMRQPSPPVRIRMLVVTRRLPTEPVKGGVANTDLHL
jgi:hypothetical protein